MDLEILNIASDTDNNRNIKNHTHRSKLKNSFCGDEIEIKIVMNKNKIIDFGFQENSCIYCQASVSLLSKIAINKQKSKINELCNEANIYFEKNLKTKNKNWTILKKIFKRKNITRKECILLPFKTLKKIVSI